MLVTLAAMLGQIGLPGAATASATTTPPVAAPPPRAAFWRDLRRQRTEEQPGTDPGGAHRRLPANPGKTIDFNGRKVTYPDIVGLRGGGNPSTHHQDTNNLVRRGASRRP